MAKKPKKRFDDDLKEILDVFSFYTSDDLCEDCKYKKSFLCDKRYADGIVETYFELYDIKIYVYEFSTNNLRKIIDRIHDKELIHHRNGGYFALKATNFHCGESVDCDCNSNRCWNFEAVPSRRQPHCIKFFGINLPEEYRHNNIAFMLGNYNKKSE